MRFYSENMNVRHNSDGNTTSERLLTTHDSIRSTATRAYIQDTRILHRRYLVHAQTKEKLFENLELIFERFRKHKITFNPDKVHLSDSEMEFVGHEFTPHITAYS